MIRLRRIIKNTVILIIGYAVSLVSTILLSVAYGHFLGAFAFGELYFAITFVSLIGILINGFWNQIMRDIAQDRESAALYFSNVLLIKLSVWFIIYPMLLLISWLLGYSLEVRILIAICGFDLLCNTIVNTFASIQIALERTFIPTVGSVLEKGLVSLLGILLLRAGAGVEVMAVVLISGSLVNAIWMAVCYFRLVGTSFVIDLRLISKLIRADFPFLISSVLMVGTASIDTVIISLMKNSNVVGLYGAASRIADATNFIPRIVMMLVLYPVISKLANTSDTELKLALEKSMNFMLFCVMPIATLLIIAAPNIIVSLYGSGFVGAVPALQVFAPYVFFLYINYVLITVVLSKRKEKFLPISGGIALIFNIVLNLILIPQFQHVGSAIAAVLTEFLLSCINVFIIPRSLLPLGSLRVAFKALIASLLMAMALLPLHTLSLFVILPMAMLVYFGASLLLGTLPWEDYVAVYYAIRRKKQSTSSPGITHVPEIPAQAYYPDTVFNIESAITMKLPVLRRQSLPENRVPSLFAHKLARTPKLPAMRSQAMQRRSLKAIRLQPMSPLPPTS